MGKESRFVRVKSMLFAILTSGKYWRCIRWCDNGTTVLITSPQLFEREVLPREMKELNLKDFASFVKMLKTVGFQQVLSARPSKTQKFRHACFQINSKEISGEGTDKERKETGRGRKRKVINNESKCFEKKTESPQKAKRPREEPTKNFGRRTAVKRKRDTVEQMDDELFTNAKKKKLNTQVSNTNQNPPKQRMTGYSEDEITAAQALLGLSLSTAEVTAVQALLGLQTAEATTTQALLGQSSGEITAAQALLGLSTGVVPMNLSWDLMSMYSLIDSFTSLALFAERSVQEIEAVQALLELATTTITR